MAVFECNTCDVVGEENFYSSAKYQCKACWNQRTYKSRKDKLQLYVTSRGGRCSRCGYDKCLEALVFHHRNPEEKDPAWNKGWNMDRLAVELEKCDLLCSNCHAEVHQENGRPQNIYDYNQ